MGLIETGLQTHGSLSQFNCVFVAVVQKDRRLTMDESFGPVYKTQKYYREKVHGI